MTKATLALTLVLLFWCFAAHATLNPERARGEKIDQFPVPGRAPEICVIPKRWADAIYSARDAKQETFLCSLDFSKNAALCPKLNSTNPGLDIHEVPAGFTPQQIEAARCAINDPKDAKTNLSKKVAKYKLSTSCSYTPSILGYYHVSRMLGDVLNVPPAVLRTLDREHHLALGNVALKEVPHGTIIQQTWQSLVSQLAAGPNASKRDLLFTDRGDQSYGALVENPGGETYLSKPSSTAVQTTWHARRICGTTIQLSRCLHGRGESARWSDVTSQPRTSKR